MSPPVALEIAARNPRGVGSIVPESRSRTIAARARASAVNASTSADSPTPPIPWMKTTRGPSSPSTLWRKARSASRPTRPALCASIRCPTVSVISSPAESALRVDEWRLAARTPGKAGAIPASRTRPSGRSAAVRVEVALEAVRGTAAQAARDLVICARDGLALAPAVGDHADEDGMEAGLLDVHPGGELVA